MTNPISQWPTQSLNDQPNLSMTNPISQWPIQSLNDQYNLTMTNPIWQRALQYYNDQYNLSKPLLQLTATAILDRKISSPVPCPGERGKGFNQLFGNYTNPFSQKNNRDSPVGGSPLPGWCFWAAVSEEGKPETHSNVPQQFNFFNCKYIFEKEQTYIVVSIVTFGHHLFLFTIMPCFYCQWRLKKLDFENAWTKQITRQPHLQNNATYSVSVILRQTCSNKSLPTRHLAGHFYHSHTYFLNNCLVDL